MTKVFCGFKQIERRPGETEAAGDATPAGEKHQEEAEVGDG